MNSAVLSAPARDAPNRLGDESVSFGARELPLQRRERLDELRGLERTVSPPDRDLLEDAGLHEPVGRLARRLERAPDQVGRRGGRQQWRAGQCAHEQISRRPAAHRLEPLAPRVLKCTELLLETPGVFGRASACAPGERDLAVDAGVGPSESGAPS